MSALAVEVDEYELWCEERQQHRLENPRRCGVEICPQIPFIGEDFCGYHQKVAAGLLEPIVPSAYDREFLKTAEHRGLARITKGVLT